MKETERRGVFCVFGGLLSTPELADMCMFDLYLLLGDVGRTSACTPSKHSGGPSTCLLHPSNPCFARAATNEVLEVQQERPFENFPRRV